VTQLLANAMGLGWDYAHASQIMDDRAPDPSFAGVSMRGWTRRALQWPVNEAAPEGSPIMHVDGFVRGKGRLLSPNISPPTNAPGRAIRCC
jgi:formate dehydrogenase major subunit